MKNSSKKYQLTLLPILVILAFSTFAPTLVYAAPTAVSDKDWQYVNGNSWAGNFSPQNQITKDNVNNLEVKWVFPVGSKSQAPPGLQTLALNEGSNTPPIVANGAVFITTNSLKTYAIDAKTGRQLWTNDYILNVSDIQKRLPVVVGAPHLHGVRYWASGDAILVGGIACDFFGIEAKTGKISFWVKDLCANVPGNLYNYRTGLGANAFNNIGTYDKGKQFIFVLPGAMHTGGYVGDARHVTMGVSMDTKQVIWRVFSYPPQDVATKDWATQECSIGFFQTYPCSEVAAKNAAGLEWDWAQPGEKPNVWGGVTANWGQALVDEDTGFIYTQTGNQGPYTNVTLTPGPRLYGSTLMAIDMNAGKRAWWLQPFPHDPYDYDCNWGGILTENPTLGKVYMKGCKEGILYVMDAKTGKPLYTVDVVQDAVGWGQISAAAAKEPSQGGVKFHLTDPLSFYDLREWGFPDNGKYCGSPCINFPSAFNGIFATDMSINPNTQTLFHYSNVVMWAFKSLPMTAGKTVQQSVPITARDNSTIVARDVATGKVKWTYFYPYSAQRSHMVVTGGMVFTGFTDGNMRFLNEDTGNLLRTINLGTGIVTGPTIGKDSDGNSKIFVIAGSTSIVGPYGGAAYGGLGALVPGTLVAIGLSDRAASTVTTTSVTTTTATTTATSTTTATTTTATTSISTTTATTTATTSTTITSTQPAQTTTLTSEVTTGLPSEITYAVAAIAVIAIIAAAFLAMRRR
ncbi:MAG: PQQ-binding-like beta-propeller repeat protein [Thaumarchaeota archaeon]|nr:PQQ-binding-like beta-propeller repeat protein [Nitrososphaerota archaeon]